MQDYRNLKVWERAPQLTLDYHLLLARDLKFMNMKDYEQLATELSEVRRMLNAFIQKLRANSSFFILNFSLFTLNF
jgi:hypothetical protein